MASSREQAYICAPRVLMSVDGTIALDNPIENEVIAAVQNLFATLKLLFLQVAKRHSVTPFDLRAKIVGSLSMVNT